MYPLRVCFITVLSLLCIAQVIGAQAPLHGRPAALAAFSSIVVQSSTPRSQTGLSAKISVDFHGITLSQALQIIAKRADLRIAMAEPVLAITKQVNLTATEIEARTAIENILAGTGVSMTVTSSGQVMFAKQAAPAVETGTIAGRVISAKTKQPVAGVTITLDTATTGVVTGEDGRFRIPVTAGEHVIHVRGVGFVRQTRRVTVAHDETVSVEFVLEPSANVLNEVIVTGTVVATERKAIPTPITVITAQDIEQRGVTRIEQLFRGEVPGVLALETGTVSYRDDIGGMVSSAVYSRGSSDPSGGANPLKVFIDGIEMLDPKYLGTIDPKSIERIEVITGPQAATIYGSGAMGGVMQIFTKRGANRTTPDVMVSLRYGMLESNMSTGRTPLHNHSIQLDGGSGASFSYASNLSYNYSGQWQPDLYSRSYGASVGVRHTQGKLNAGGTVSTTAGSNGTSTGRTGPYIIQKIQSGDWVPYTSWASILPMEKINRSSALTVGLTLDYSATPTWQHHVTVGRNQTNLYLEPQRPQYTAVYDTMYRHSRSSGQRTSASYNFTWMPASMRMIAPTLTIGMNGSWGEMTNIYGSTASKAATSMTNPSVGQALSSESWGGFSSFRLGVFDRLFVTLGLRGERNPAYGRAHKIDWTPTNGVAYTHEYRDLTVKLLASYGSGTRPPTSSMRLGRYSSVTGYDIERYEITRESPLLTPEYERGPQGGIELYYGNLGAFTVTYYQQDVTDLIRSILVDTTVGISLSDNSTRNFYTYQYLNVGKMRKKGWEGTGSINIAQLSLKGTYFWNDSRVVTVNPGVPFTGDGFSDLPTHGGNVTVTYALAGTSVTLVNNITGGIVTQDNTNELYWMEPAWSRLRMYVDRRKTDQSFGRSRPGYVKSDLVFTQRINAQVSALLNIMNLGNSYGRDVSEVGFPALGRQTLVGVSVRYR